MYRGTTPTLTINVNTTLTLSNMKEIWVTLKSMSNELTYTKSDEKVAVVETGNKKQLQVTLTQLETLAFVQGKIKIQARFLDQSDKAFASTIKECSINEILKDGEIS